MHVIRRETPYEYPTPLNIEGDLQKHISTTHNNLSMSMPSLLSQADDSSWMYMTCNLCNGRFQNEKDLSFHMENKGP